ncbi:hypothetical protein PR202_gb20961 [Eleusine coracana subsp. coracana]|uniref:Uncharacterized protein n=1 Tax=Eleusine coracana subsp. coracana TaxID=191504 RepID=A0AAV5FCA7_ELECO|nr:hypothetical protein PR202_gb20961 [Eleusine coracana subsp. coracana]
MLLRRASTAGVAAKRFSSLTRARDRRRAGAAGRGHATSSSSTPTSSSPPRRRGNCRAPPAFAEEITDSAAPRPFPDYHPPRPDSPADYDLARRLAAAVLASPDPASLPPLPFLPTSARSTSSSRSRSSPPTRTSRASSSRSSCSSLAAPSSTHTPTFSGALLSPPTTPQFATPAPRAPILVRAVRFPSPHRHFRRAFHLHLQRVLI